METKNIGMLSATANAVGLKVRVLVSNLNISSVQVSSREQHFWQHKTLQEIFELQENWLKCKLNCYAAWLACSCYFLK
jgi:hypothetical protein